jgi:hypothetical protein
MVVFANLSLFKPFWYENLEDSINALAMDLNGRVKLFPWFSILSVASRLLGSTYKIEPRTDFMKLSNLERPILLFL